MPKSVPHPALVHLDAAMAALFYETIRQDAQTGVETSVTGIDAVGIADDLDELDRRTRGFDRHQQRTFPTKFGAIAGAIREVIIEIELARRALGGGSQPASEPISPLDGNHGGKEHA